MHFFPDFIEYQTLELGVPGIIIYFSYIPVRTFQAIRNGHTMKVFVELLVAHYMCKLELHSVFPNTL